MFPLPPCTVPVALEKISFPAGLSLLVLAPHPDDFDAVAVCLKFFHKQGAVIHLAVLTSSAEGVQDGYKQAYTRAEKEGLREDEQRASCAFFGLPSENIVFLNLAVDEHGELRLDDEENQAAVRAQLLHAKPDIVFMPHGNDSNLTHQRTYALFRRVAVEAGMKLWAMLNRDAKTIAMRTDVFMPFDEEEAVWKGKLLRYHDSQQQRNLNTRGKGFDERVLAVEHQVAESLGIKQRYAEVFELEHFGEV